MTSKICIVSPLFHCQIPSVLFVLTIHALGFGFASSASGSNQDDRAQNGISRFQAGAAMSNITPPLGEPIVGGWRPTPATHVHDELHARCLVLDNGQTRLGIVLCDNVGIPREVYDKARAILGETTDLEPRHILMAATHTHSATSARTPNKLRTADELGDYQKFLARRIADGVRRAIHNLEPARIGWGSAQVPSQVFNRRWFVSPDAEEVLRNPFGGHDKVRMNPPRMHPALLEPAGPTDPEVAFLSVQSQNGRPIALLANYSLHYVGGVPQGDVSADYFALFAERIAKLLRAEEDASTPFVGIMSNGTSGDINNINFQKSYERRPPYEKMRQVAHLVAAKVFAAHQNVRFRDWVRLDIIQDEITIASRKPTEELLEWANSIQQKPEEAEAFHSRERIYAERVLRQNEAPKNISVVLQTLRIGDLAITAIPFEVFAEIGLEIKEQSPFEQTFTIELANGSYGYLPTPRQHELGGYETWLGTNLVEKDASTKIVEKLLRMLGDLKK